MKKEDTLYLNLILFHAGIGLLVFLFPFVSKIYGYAIFILGPLYIIKKQNKNNEALILVESKRTLYLAIPLKVYTDFFEEPLSQYWNPETVPR